MNEFASRILTSPDLETKLAPAPAELRFGPPIPDGLGAPDGPARGDALSIVEGSRAKVPGLGGMREPISRGRILHAFANHELQAVELFAWALLAFPETPEEFRRGLLGVLGEEQRHTRMYCKHLERFGLELGSLPVSGYFWNKVHTFTTPLRFICAMSLTFENANLDLTAEYSAEARAAGDEPTARLLERIQEDEVGHVAFGWTWLERWRETDASAWQTYSSHLAWPLRPGRARSEFFHRDARLRAGLAEDFVQELERTPPVAPFARPQRGRGTPGQDGDRGAPARDART